MSVDVNLKHCRQQKLIWGWPSAYCFQLQMTAELWDEEILRSVYRKEITLKGKCSWRPTLTYIRKLRFTEICRGCHLATAGRIWVPRILLKTEFIVTRFSTDSNFCVGNNVCTISILCDRKQGKLWRRILRDTYSRLSRNSIAVVGKTVTTITNF